MPDGALSAARERSSYGPAFIAGLLNPDSAPPVVVAGPQGKAVTRRYAVYRNNVTVSLINALAAVYPATKRITGPDFFRAMARLHVRAQPPTSPLLFEYGRDFPDFIASYEHARAMPWLSDVARIERAWLDAYHAADAAPLAPDALTRVATESLPRVKLKPHPAMRVIRSPFPAATIFAANRIDAPVGRITTAEAEDALVTRPHLDVAVRRLPPGGALFIGSLSGGATLSEAAGRAASAAAAFDLAGNIRGIFEAGAFVAVTTGGEHE